MSASEVGKQVLDLCREGKNLEAIEQFYANDVVSVESAPFEDMPRTAEGIEAVKGKNQWWVENNEVHSGNVQGPFVHGDDHFSAVVSFDITPKGGDRMQMTEIGVYTVAGDKIVKDASFAAWE